MLSLLWLAAKLSSSLFNPELSVMNAYNIRQFILFIYYSYILYIIQYSIAGLSIGAYSYYRSGSPGVDLHPSDPSASLGGREPQYRPGMESGQ